MKKWCRRGDSSPRLLEERGILSLLRDASSEGAVSMTPFISWESQEDYESRALTRLGHCGIHTFWYHVETNTYSEVSHWSN